MKSSKRISAGPLVCVAIIAISEALVLWGIENSYMLALLTIVVRMTFWFMLAVAMVLFAGDDNG